MSVEDLKKAMLKRVVDSHAGAGFVTAVMEESTDETTTADEVERALGKRGLTVGRKAIIEVFKALADLQAGQFIVGRRGHKTRFEWHLPDEGRGARERLANTESTTPTISHSYRLRPQFEVRVLLPADLSNAEAERLGGFIQTLPFG